MSTWFATVSALSTAEPEGSWSPVATGEAGVIAALARKARTWLSSPVEHTRFPPTRDVRKHHVRVVMDAQVEKIIRGLDPSRCDAFEVSGTFHEHWPWRAYRSSEYPDFDVCEPASESELGRYDVVIAEQVLEHVPEPLVALRTMRALCRPGGHVVVTTPFLIRIHPSPHDYWRFTPEGLEHLMRRAGLESVTMDSWGNKQAVRGAFYSWPRRMPWHSLRNEPDLPAVVWGVGANPG